MAADKAVTGGAEFGVGGGHSKVWTADGDGGSVKGIDEDGAGDGEVPCDGGASRLVAKTCPFRAFHQIFTDEPKQEQNPNYHSPTVPCLFCRLADKNK